MCNPLITDPEGCIFMGKDGIVRTLSLYMYLFSLYKDLIFF